MAVIDIADRPGTDTFLQVPPGSALGSARLGWAVPVAAPLARRRWAVRVAKYVLPVVAIALLASIAVWPELSRSLANGRVTWRRLAAINTDAGRMLQPRYRGVDERQRPYTVSAATADRAGPERVNLTTPVGDLTLANGTWLLLRAKTGVFIQHSNELDLANAVTLYRQDGTIMQSATATMNLKQGAATSNDYTHAEGPFGTLDAEGFTLVDRGGVIQFHGPAKLVLNGAH
jgi:lipopolysaccharide export system protein LptC